MELGELLKECSSCIWFDGDLDDESAFCEEHEGYVMGNSKCCKWKSKELNKTDI